MMNKLGKERQRKEGNHMRVYVSSKSQCVKRARACVGKLLVYAVSSRSMQPGCNDTVSVCGREKLSPVSSTLTLPPPASLPPYTHSHTRTEPSCGPPDVKSWFARAADTVGRKVVTVAALTLLPTLRAAGFLLVTELSTLSAVPWQGVSLVALSFTLVLPSRLGWLPSQWRILLHTISPVYFHSRKCRERDQLETLQLVVFV